MESNCANDVIDIYILVFYPYRGCAFLFLYVSSTLVTNTILVRPGPFWSFFFLFKHYASVTPLLCCNFWQQIHGGLSSTGIYLHNRNHRVAGARCIFIWRGVFAILRNAHLLLTKWIYVCGALSKGMLPSRMRLYIKEANTSLPISIPSRTFPSPSHSHDYLPYFPRVVPPP